MIKISNKKIVLKNQGFDEKSDAVLLNVILSIITSFLVTLFIGNLFTLNSIAFLFTFFIMFIITFFSFHLVREANYHDFLNHDISRNEMLEIVEVLEPLNLPIELKNKLKQPIKVKKLKSIIIEINNHIDKQSLSLKEDKLKKFFEES